jgi:hypothetical protein
VSKLPPVDTSAPGGPTSIEPKHPVQSTVTGNTGGTATTQPPLQPGANPTPATPAVPAQEPIQTSTLIGGGLIVLGLAAGAFFLFSRKR